MVVKEGEVNSVVILYETLSAIIVADISESVSSSDDVAAEVVTVISWLSGDAVAIVAIEVVVAHHVQYTKEYTINDFDTIFVVDFCILINYVNRYFDFGLPDHE